MFGRILAAACLAGLIGSAATVARGEIIVTGTHLAVEVSEPVAVGDPGAGPDLYGFTVTLTNISGDYPDARPITFDSTAPALTGVTGLSVAGMKMHQELFYNAIPAAITPYAGPYNWKYKATPPPKYADVRQHPVGNPQAGIDSHFLFTSDDIASEDILIAPGGTPFETFDDVDWPHSGEPEEFSMEGTSIPPDAPDPGPYSTFGEQMGGSFVDTRVATSSWDLAWVVGELGSEFTFNAFGAMWNQETSEALGDILTGSFIIEPGVVVDDNNTKILINGVPEEPADSGQSVMDIDFGDVVQDAVIRHGVQLDKTGSMETSYQAIVAGKAETVFPVDPTAIGADDPTALPGWVGINTADLGAAAGTVVIDNLATTSAGAGLGSDDADDAFNVSAHVIGANETHRRKALAGVVPEGGSYAGIQSETTENAEAGLLGTKMELLGGGNLNSDEEWISTTWRERTADETRVLISDVVNLEGITDGDVFVLQMSYDPTAILGGLDETELAQAGKIHIRVNLGTEPDPDWVGAHGGPFNLGSWQAAGSPLALGTWGVDVDNDVAWVVTDHNSELAIVPEPGTVLLLLSGAVAVLLCWRRRRCRA